MPKGCFAFSLQSPADQHCGDSSASDHYVEGSEGSEASSRFLRNTREYSRLRCAPSFPSDSSATRKHDLAKPRPIVSMVLCLRSLSRKPLHPCTPVRLSPVLPSTNPCRLQARPLPLHSVPRRPPRQRSADSVPRPHQLRLPSASPPSALGLERPHPLLPSVLAPAPSARPPVSVCSAPRQRRHSVWRPLNSERTYPAGWSARHQQPQLQRPAAASEAQEAGCSGNERRRPRLARWAHPLHSIAQAVASGLELHK